MIKIDLSRESRGLIYTNTRVGLINSRGICLDSSQVVKH